MKSEVYSWRLSSDLKCELEEEARRERVSVSQLLERIVREWLKTRSTAAEADGGARAAARTRDAPLRHAAQRDPDLSEKLSERVREGILRARMRAQGLIDTGAMLALLHQDDRWHARCVETFGRLRVPWATSVAVLTEILT